MRVHGLVRVRAPRAAQSKAHVFKAIEDTAPARFRTFLKSALMDRFLHAAVLYFVAKFQLQAAQQPHACA